MLVTRSDKVFRRLLAISFKPSQNASSRLTLVLCPTRTIERFTTVDFMAPLLFQRPIPPSANAVPNQHYYTSLFGRGFFERIRYHCGVGQQLRQLQRHSCEV